MSGDDKVVALHGIDGGRAGLPPPLTDGELIRVRAMLAEHEAIVSKRGCPVAQSVLQGFKTINEGCPTARRLLDPS